jgi:Sugar phosphate isomerases/epimerases
MFNNSIGVIYKLSDLLENGPEKLFDLGIECVQIQSWTLELQTKENAEKVKEMLKDKIIISSFWAGWSGPRVWDSIDGPHTLGIVPLAYRFQRIEELLKGADFANWLGVENIATHFGFIPEHPSFPEYRGVVQAVAYIANYCKIKGLYLNFETGQETPVTLMRIIKDIGNDNLGINLDPANLILYGRGNPVDALDIFKGYIKGVHIKDADYTTEYYKLGKERVVGEGTVNFPVFLPKLLRQGYKGDLFIEREISGDQQIKDIKKTVDYVKKLMKEASYR